MDGLYKAGFGRPAIPFADGRATMAQAHSNLSEGEVVALWVDNPYWQHFCGEPDFRHDLPIDPSLMTSILKCVCESGCKFILGLTVQVSLAIKMVAKTSLAVVNVLPRCRTRP